MTVPRENDADPCPCRSDQLARIIDDCIARRAAGEVVNDQSLIDENPTLMPELAEQLRRLSVIESGVNRADAQPRGASYDRRCPECGNLLELKDAENSAQSYAVCSACQTRFRFAEHGPGLQPGGHLGRFEIVNKLGEGAFGSVWCARDSQLDRLVAIKVACSGYLSGEPDQFVREARAVAQLQHPHIVRVHDVDREGDTVFLVADYVPGENLAQRLSSGRIASGQAAELCAKLADALDHAHQHGVVHRDLKPSNIMIDGGGEPHLMDFGLAKREGHQSTMTMDGKLLGTPAYMSPEQARGSAHDADRRSDVYSLGVILYELVAGERPFRGSTQMLLHQILFEDAPNLRRLNPAVTKDLETVCLKCLEKNPRQRYQTAAELAADLRRFLGGTPIHARPTTRLSRVWRWSKRNPITSGLIGALILSIAAGFAGVTSMWWRASQVRDAHQQLAFELASDRGFRLLEEGNVASGMLWLARSLELTPQRSRDVGRTLRANIAFWESQLMSFQRFLPTETGISCAAFSPDGHQLVIGTTEGRVSLWDTKKWNRIGRFSVGKSEVSMAAVRPEYLLTCCEGDDTIRLWDKMTCEPIGPSISQKGRVAAVSPDGESFVVATNDGPTRIWNWKTGRQVGRDIPHGVIAAAYSPDGSLILAADEAAPARLWDANTGQPVCDPLDQMRGLWAVAFNRDGTRFATGGDHEVIIADTATGEPVIRLTGHIGRILHLSFSLDGRHVVAQGGGTIWIWDLQLRRITHRLPLDCDLMALVPDGTHLVTDGTDRAARLWHLPRPDARHTVFDHGGSVLGVDVSMDGSTMVTSGSPNGLQLWNIDAPDSPLKSMGGQFYRVSYFPHDHARAVVSQNQTEVVCWDLDSMRPDSPPLVHGDWVNSVDVSPDGALVLTACFDQRARLWDTSTNEVTVIEHPDQVMAAAFVPPDGTKLVTACEDGQVRLWDLRTGKWIGEPMRHATGLLDVAVSFDGTLLAGACADGTVQLWELETQRRFGNSLHHGARVRSIAFSHDGAYVVAGCEDGTVRCWDIAAGTPIILPRRHQGKVYDVLFTPSDSHVLSASSIDGTVRMWDVPRQPIEGDVQRLTAWVDVITGLSLERGQDNKIRVLDQASWDERRRELQQLGGPPNRPSRASFR